MQALLGHMLLAGYGTQRDVAEGLRWLERASDRDADALRLLTALRAGRKLPGSEGEEDTAPEVWEPRDIGASSSAWS